jgi:superfamily II DNA or RNA helicase
MTQNLPVLTKLAFFIKSECSDQGLRPYQLKLYNDVQNEWVKGARNVLAVLPTGGGKTRILSAIVRDHNGASCVIAHRQELVSQISMALARNGVRHRIIGPNKLIRMVVQQHMIELKASFYDPNARTSVAGVDTIMSWLGTGEDGDFYVYDAPNGIKWLYGPRLDGRWGKPKKIGYCNQGTLSTPNPSGALVGKRPPKDMSDQLRKYTPTVGLWVIDEAHHVLKANKWGKAAEMFPNARGLGVTATPCRADGAGLGRHADGLMDVMVIGPTMRQLIEDGFLTEYRIFAPPSDLASRMGNVKISATTNDFNVNQVRDAVEHSSLVDVPDDGTKRIVGDVVQTYLNKFKGMLSVVFVPSVVSAEKLEAQFIASGITAKSLNGNTDDEVRINSIRKFARRELMVLINVALFDEGFDLPAIEVVQDAYPTNSYGRYCQRFGRMLRLMDGKDFGIYSDHAGNVARHGLPDAKREWSLDRREKRGDSKAEDTTRTCVDHKVDGVVTKRGCYGVFERYLKVCKYCGLEIRTPTPAERTGPEHVDGDLFELDADTLAAMRGEVAKVDRPMDEAVAEYRADLMRKHTPAIGVMAHTKRFAVKLEAQQTAIGALREIMAIWAGHYRAAGRDDSEIFRRFYLRYGVDWLSAQALSSEAALALGSRVAIDIGSM